MQDIDTILKLVEDKVVNNTPMSPAYWIESALRLNAVKHTLDDQIIALECTLNDIEAELLKQDMPASKTKVLARNQMGEKYKELLTLKAKDARINEWTMLAKKRATVQDI